MFKPKIYLFQLEDYAKLLSSGKKLYSLPFDVVLNNNIGLSYFIGEFACTTLFFFSDQILLEFALKYGTENVSHLNLCGYKTQRILLII